MSFFNQFTPDVSWRTAFKVTIVKSMWTADIYLDFYNELSFTGNMCLWYEITLHVFIRLYKILFYHFYFSAFSLVFPLGNFLKKLLLRRVYAMASHSSVLLLLFFLLLNVARHISMTTFKFNFYLFIYLKIYHPKSLANYYFGN